MIPLAAVIAVATAVGLGAERRSHEAAERAARGLLTTVLWVLLPIIVFFNIAALDLTVEIGAGVGFAYVAMAVTLGAAFAAGTYVLRLPRASVGALMVAAALANTGFLGLPFTVALFGFDELPNALVYDILVSSLALATVGFTVGALFGTRAEGARARLRTFLTRNPPLWATAAGFLAPALLAPDWAVDGSQLLALAILPIGFFAVGVTLAAEARERGVGLVPPLSAPVAWAVALKLLLPAAVLLGLSRLLLDVPDSYLTQAGMASALSNIVIANEYGLDRRLIAGAILWSTALVVAAGVFAVLT